MKIKRRPMPAPHIPFISLADIAWQIIIFFFMAASFTKLDAMRLDPPSSTSDAKSQQQDKMLTVTVREQGISIDGAASNIADLTQRVTALKSKPREQRVVIVEGSKGLSFQKNVDVLYAIRNAGGVPVISELDESAK